MSWIILHLFSAKPVNLVLSCIIYYIIKIVKDTLITICLILLSTVVFSQSSHLGWVTKNVNLREGPGTDYAIVRALKQGNQIFINSTEPVSDFFSIVDIATDTEGYVHKSYVKIGNSATLNEEGMFTQNGNTGTENPELEIFNNTQLKLSLKLNDDLYTLLPNQKKIIPLSPGRYKYRASAPGVIPNIGVETVANNIAYSWEFFISSSRR